MCYNGSIFKSIGQRSLSLKRQSKARRSKTSLQAKLREAGVERARQIDAVEQKEKERLALKKGLSKLDRST